MREFVFKERFLFSFAVDALNSPLKYIFFALLLLISLIWPKLKFECNLCHCLCKCTFLQQLVLYTLLMLLHSMLMLTLKVFGFSHFLCILNIFVSKMVRILAN